MKDDLAILKKEFYRGKSQERENILYLIKSEFMYARSHSRVSGFHPEYFHGKLIALGDIYYKLSGENLNAILESDG